MKKMKKAVHIHSDKIISFSFDALARAVYVRYTNEPIAKTKRLDSSVSIDYDKNGEIVGVEVIRISRAAATIKKVVRDASRSFPKEVKEEVAPFLEPALA